VFNDEADTVSLTDMTVLWLLTASRYINNLPTRVVTTYIYS